MARNGGSERPLTSGAWCPLMLLRGAFIQNCEIKSPVSEAVGVVIKGINCRARLPGSNPGSMPLISCATLCKMLSLSGPQCLHL